MSLSHPHAWSACSQSIFRPRSLAFQQLPRHGQERPYDERFVSLRRARSTGLVKRHAVSSHVPAAASGLEQAFVRALVRAGQCHSHRHSLSGTQLRHGARPKHVRDKDVVCQVPSSRRHFSAQAQKHATPQPVASVYRVSPDELHGLVDQHGYAKQETGLLSRQTHFSEDDELALNENRRRQAEEQEKQRLKRENLRKLQHLLNDEDTPHELLMSVYNDLPIPGAAHLTMPQLRLLWRRLSALPHKSEASKLRFFQVMNDARAAKRDLPISAWTSAMNFAGRAVKRISNDEVQDALSVWKQMETEAGVKANSITFNVLFDVASKARKFVLADMIHDELLSRGLPMTRFFRMSLINHYGLKGDSAAVRHAYHEFVESGGFVDSAVIACVIDAFAKCSEPAAAEMTFMRAKRLHATKTNGPAPPRDWKESRKVGRILHEATEARMRGDDSAAAAQTVVASVAPGVRAYAALISHYAMKEGNIERVTELLDEMEAAGLPTHGAIFLYLFKGFTIHGGLLYSAWTRRRLETTYAAFVAAVQASAPLAALVPADAERVYVSQSMAMLCVGAFAKCTSLERMRAVWEELLGLWMPREDERRAVEDVIAQLEAEAEDWAALPTGQRARSMHFYLR